MNRYKQDRLIGYFFLGLIIIAVLLILDLLGITNIAEHSLNKYHSINP